MGAFRWILAAGLPVQVARSPAAEPEGLPIRVITEDSPPGEVVGPGWFGSVAREAGSSHDEVKPVFNGQRQDLYIALSKDTPLATVRAWQVRLDPLLRDGTMAQFYRGTYPERDQRTVSPNDLQWW